MMQLDWLIPGYLAGSVRPVTAVEPGADLRWLHDRGIRLLVSLTDAPPETSEVPETLEILHFPLADGGVPSARATANVCRKMIDAIVGGRPVAVNGSTGSRRTATLLACCMVAWRGHADGALDLVQQMGPAYAPTRAQQEFVRRFETDLQMPWSRPWDRRREDPSAEGGPQIRRISSPRSA